MHTLPSLVVSGCFPRGRLVHDVRGHLPTHSVSLAGRTDGEDGAWAVGFLRSRTDVHTLVPCDDLCDPLPGYRPPCAQDVDALLALADQLRSDHRLLVHCHAGLSRSPAAALVVGVAIARRAGALNEQAAHAVVDWVRDAQPFARPNARIVHFLCAHLAGSEVAHLHTALQRFDA